VAIAALLSQRNIEQAAYHRTESQHLAALATSARVPGHLPHAPAAVRLRAAEGVFAHAIIWASASARPEKWFFTYTTHLAEGADEMFSWWLEE